MSETPANNTEVLQTLVKYHDNLLETTEEWVSEPNSSKQLPIPKGVTQVVSQTHKEGGKVQYFYNPETCAQRCLQVLENAGGPIPTMTIVNKSNKGGEEEYLGKEHLIQHEGISALLEQEPTILNYTSVIKALSQHKDSKGTAKRVQDILARTIVIGSQDSLVVIQRTVGDSISQTGVYILGLTTNEISSWYMVKDKTTSEAPIGLFSSTNTNKKHETAWMELETVIRRYYDSDGGNNRSDNNPNQPTDGARRKKTQPVKIMPKREF